MRYGPKSEYRSGLGPGSISAFAATRGVVFGLVREAAGPCGRIKKIVKEV
jgi:hypothetical protein